MTINLIIEVYNPGALKHCRPDAWVGYVYKLLPKILANPRKDVIVMPSNLRLLFSFKVLLFIRDGLQWYIIKSIVELRKKG